MRSPKEIQNTLDDTLEANKTHLKRMKNLSDELMSSRFMFKDLNQKVINTLSYYGYDLQAQDFIDEHNKTALKITDLFEQIFECLLDLNEDVVKIIATERDAIQEELELLEKMDKKYEKEISQE